MVVDMTILRTIKLEPMIGSKIEDVMDIALTLYSAYQCKVIFTFNDVDLHVSKKHHSRKEIITTYNYLLK